MEDTTLRLIFREGLSKTYSSIFALKKKRHLFSPGKKFPWIENMPLPHNTHTQKKPEEKPVRMFPEQTEINSFWAVRCSIIILTLQSLSEN